MPKFEVTLFIGTDATVFDVDADRHRIESPICEGVPPFIVFYRDAPIVLDPLASQEHSQVGTEPKCICGWEVDGFTAPELVDEKLQAHIAARNEQPALPLNMDGASSFTSTAVDATAEIEVFRAPVHALYAVQLVGEDDDEEDDD